MAHVYFKSLLWLIGLGGTGYVLLQLTPDRQGTLSNKLSTKFNTNLTDEQKKKALILNKLKEAATEPPIYLERKK